MMKFSIHIQGFSQKFSRDTTSKNIKRMGKFDEAAFENTCNWRFLHAVAEIKAMKICFQWHPFEVIPIEGKHQEVMDKDEEVLCNLKDEWGMNSQCSCESLEGA
ncbi:unnamed protein product [Fraxinus pennsylvanica]|uniref:Factor of DNA methylation 1-5/IDN2 domain-containing protein n=1 Tax=Fraxinus pennsylvanica TaxID=56036 RepID=A0AAD1ZJ06_9LAMI|nr:unnamed protein product [Fraxinus pennsylvanica]